MTVFRRFGTLTTAVAVFTLITAVQMGLIAFGNITDYGTNHEFVTRVFAMDTTFKTTMWRAITDPLVVTVAYIAIIAWEAASAGVLFTAAFFWMRPRGSRGHDTARRLSTAGWLMWVILFGGGFIAIGGEWFSMWQSETWNGQESAWRNLAIAVFGLILAHLHPYSETIIISEPAEQ